MTRTERDRLCREAWRLRRAAEAKGATSVAGIPKQPQQPLLEAAKLWQRTSAAGRRYLIGRMGSLRVLVFENRDRADETAPTHLLMVTAAATADRLEREKAEGAWRAATGTGDG